MQVFRYSGRVPFRFRFRMPPPLAIMMTTGLRKVIEIRNALFVGSPVGLMQAHNWIRWSDETFNCSPFPFILSSMRCGPD